jgi:hypothetical protein
VDIIRWGLYNIDRGKKIIRKYPYRLFLKTLFYADLSEGKESYPMRDEKTAGHKELQRF